MLLHKIVKDCVYLALHHGLELGIVAGVNLVAIESLRHTMEHNEATVELIVSMLAGALAAAAVWAILRWWR